MKFIYITMIALVFGSNCYGDISLESIRTNIKNTKSCFVIIDYSGAKFLCDDLNPIKANNTIKRDTSANKTPSMFYQVSNMMEQDLLFYTVSCSLYEKNVSRCIYKKN